MDTVEEIVAQSLWKKLWEGDIKRYVLTAAFLQGSQGELSTRPCLSRALKTSVGANFMQSENKS